MAILVAISMTACGILPKTPTQVIGSLYVTIESVAELSMVAYQDGHIDANQLLAIKGELQRSHDLLELTERTVQSGGDAASHIEIVSAILRRLQESLEAQMKEPPA